MVCALRGFFQSLVCFGTEGGNGAPLFADALAALFEDFVGKVLEFL